MLNTMNEIRSHIETILANDQTVDQRLTEVCELLRDTHDHYDWVGFYFADHDSRMLHLGPFAGEPTDHTKIPFGKGICGQVAESNANFVVPDVQAQDNYIACSINVKSEIVVPLFKDGVNIGQIDIDSNKIDPFTEEDERLLEWVNAKVSEIL
jgi:GAF domain-containing protein